MEIGVRVLRETASRRAAAVERERGPIKKDKKQRSEKEKEKKLKNEFSSLGGRVSHPPWYNLCKQNYSRKMLENVQLQHPIECLLEIFSLNPLNRRKM